MEIPDLIVLIIAIPLFMFLGGLVTHCVLEVGAWFGDKLRGKQ